jgi:hypothetical protein
MIRANAQVLTVGFVAVFLASIFGGCSSKKTTIIVAQCDSTKCAPQNTCIGEDEADAGLVVDCRRLCTSQTDPQTGCPANYTCVPTSADATDGGVVQTYCSANNTTYPPAPNGTGQWGTSCNPAGGLTANPDCDSADGFQCYGTSPSDGNAYCTQLTCTTDRDCAGGFYCGTYNTSPNVTTTKRVIGSTALGCLKREYCAPCNTDLDCLAVNNLPSHCIGDANGVNFCASECTTNAGCNLEAACVAVPNITPLVCYPRAHVCVGDGGLCAPCRSDADCVASDGTQGACTEGEYTTEHSCSTPAPKPPCFDTSGNPTGGGCPTTDEVPKGKVGCYGGTDFKEIPANYCHGYITLGGTGSDGTITPGCFTPNR